MVVLFDFDEVFVDLNTGALKYINNELGTAYTHEDVTSWEFFDKPDVRKPFLDFLSLPDVYQKHVIPNKKMIKVLEQMVEMGKEVYIVTASVESSQESKYQFIKENMPFFDTKNLFTVNNSSKYKMKSDVLEELKLDYHEPTVLVDDGIHNVLDMMADINHKEKLDDMMKQFYINRTLKKFNNPYHEFIYGIIPELTYNKDIEEGKRIFRLKETKDIWKLLKNIDENHKQRVENKQAEVFNYINNIVNENLPDDGFKSVNELQNNVSFLTKSLLGKTNKNADFVSDIARLLVKVEKITDSGQDKKETLEKLFTAPDTKFGNDVMYSEIKNIVLYNVASEEFKSEAVDGKRACRKYAVLNKETCILKSIIQIARENMDITKVVLDFSDNEKVKNKVTSLLHETGLAYTVDFSDRSAMSANINLALNKNYEYSKKEVSISPKSDVVENLRRELISSTLEAVSMISRVETKSSRRP